MGAAASAQPGHAIPRLQSRSGQSTSNLLATSAARLRNQAGLPLAKERIAGALAQACRRWREPGFAPRVSTLTAAATADGHGQSESLLSASLDALLAGFTPDALDGLARRLSGRDRLIGLIMPGNVMGAGLHELVQALIGGAAVLVKAASAQPLFFAEFQRTLAAIDAEVAERMEVALWSRLDRESTATLVRVCDRVAVFGDDETIAALAASAGPKLVDFGSRLSGALIAREADCGHGCAINRRRCGARRHLVRSARLSFAASCFCRSLRSQTRKPSRRRWPANGRVGAPDGAARAPMLVDTSRRAVCAKPLAGVRSAAHRRDVGGRRFGLDSDLRPGG